MLLAIHCGSSAASAQDSGSTLTPRQLFYTERSRNTKPASSAKPAAPPKASSRPAKPKASPPQAAGTPAPAENRRAEYLGIRYSVLQVLSNGRLEEVNPEKDFRAGDRIKLKVTPNESGHLYIVHQGSSGNWDVLFPTAGIRQGSNSVSRLEAVTVPEGDLDFTFDNRPGAEKLFVVLSERPEHDLDALIYSLRDGKSAGGRTLLASASIPAEGIDKLRSGLVSRDLRVERRPSEPSSGRREEAVYVVNASTTRNNGRVIAEISLRHR